MQDAAEILIDRPMAMRGERMLEAISEAAPAGSVITDRYRGNHQLLVVYGVGQDNRLNARAEQFTRGGHVAMWDLGYWGEGMRLSINSLHPTRQQIERADDGRAGGEEAATLREESDPSGPIVLVGLGNKSARMLGFEPMQWERRKLREIRNRFPESKVLWRPKGRRSTPITGTKMICGGAIDDVLAGASLVVCRHSNVAIDACIAGVPVECEDGAARALYEGNPAPSAEQRRQFLRRLSWWNWKPTEAPDAWRWIQRMTSCV